jgi:hypothetical protein
MVVNNRLWFSGMSNPNQPMHSHPQENCVDCKADMCLCYSARKSPDDLEDAQKEIKKAGIRILPDPSDEEILANLYLMDDPNDVPILLAAIKAKVDYLATHDRKHFLDDPKVSEKIGS